MIWEAMEKMLPCDLVRLLWMTRIMSMATLVTTVLMARSIAAGRLFGSPADLSSHPRSWRLLLCATRSLNHLLY